VGGPEHRERRRGERREGVDGEQRPVGGEQQSRRRGGDRADQRRPHQHAVAREAVGQSRRERREQERRRHAGEGHETHGGGAPVTEGDHAERDHERPLGGPGRAEGKLRA
jgi:hypothetical protein